MIRWVRSLEAVDGLERPWAWLTRVNRRRNVRMLRGLRPRTDELTYAARLPSEAAGANRLARQLLLRAFAARALRCPVDCVRIAHSATGEPSVAAPIAAFVSVAARGDWALLAVSPTPIGVDLELVGEPAPPIDLFHPAEQAGCAAAGLATKRLSLGLWVAKEAYAKASGQRLDHVLSQTVADWRSDKTLLRDGSRVVHIDLLAMRRLIVGAVAL